MKCVINKMKDIRVLLSISKRASLNEVILNNFFIVNNVRPLIYLCYLLLPNLLFDVLHRWMVLRRGYSKQLFHRKQCQAINLFVLSLAPESIV